MTKATQQDIALKARKLAQMAAKLRQGEHFPITRLTIIKRLCQKPAVAARFVTHLARLTLNRVNEGQGRTRQPLNADADRRRELMTEAVGVLEQSLNSRAASVRERLLKLFGKMRQEQNEHKKIPFGTLRLIRDWDLLLIEHAVQCVRQPNQSPYWAYQTARNYAERYSSKYGNGLIPDSAPLVQDIADFWAGEAGIDGETVPTSAADTKRSARMAGARPVPAVENLAPRRLQEAKQCLRTGKGSSWRSSTGTLSCIGRDRPKSTCRCSSG